MQNIDYRQVTITSGLWKSKQDMVREKTVWAVYDRYVETGRFAAFRCDWKPGEENEPHFFWDSDVAKWIEGAAYLTAKKHEPNLEKIVDALVDLIEKNQGADGYFNVYFTVVEPENRFKFRTHHELYCAGHLMEAAVAYYEATGKRKMLDLMCRYADYIEKRFVIDRDAGFATPGHEEIELALVRLADCTGERRYLDLAKHFVDTRGAAGNGDGVEADEPNGSDPRYSQSHLPVCEQTSAEGHAVRAVYLYCGMADVARRTGDAALRRACEALFDDIALRKMYVTGGIGSNANGEAFTVPFDLPNLLAYSESCAAIGLVFFAHRMLAFGANSKYSDVIERVLYNGFLSSVSLDGTAFFYENPLELLPYLSKRDVYQKGRRALYLPQTRRQKNFWCSCCPPNIVRFLASLSGLIYGDDGETLYVHQFMQSKTEIKRAGKTIAIEQKTRYPENGKVRLTVRGGDVRVGVRVPWWCERKFDTVSGYFYKDLADGEMLELNFGMPVRYVAARPEAIFDCNRFAVMRGPVVYCTEGGDNETPLRDLRLDARAAFHYGKHPTLGVPQLTVKAWRREKPAADAPLYAVREADLVPATATLIPYYAFANREASEMQVWHYLK